MYLQQPWMICRRQANRNRKCHALSLQICGHHSVHFQSILAVWIRRNMPVGMIHRDLIMSPTHLAHHVKKNPSDYWRKSFWNFCSSQKVGSWIWTQWVKDEKLSVKEEFLYLGRRSFKCEAETANLRYYKCFGRRWAYWKKEQKFGAMEVSP